MLSELVHKVLPGPASFVPGKPVQLSSFLCGIAANALSQRVVCVRLFSGEVWSVDLVAT
jgi:hypothetical protein